MADSKPGIIGSCSSGCTWDNVCLVSVSKRVLDSAPSNLLLTGSISPLLDDTDTIMLVKRQVPLDCVLYRYGSFSLTLDIVRESCLCWGLRKGGISCQGWPVVAYLGRNYLRILQWHRQFWENIPWAFLYMVLVEESIPNLKPCNLAEGIESAEILQAVPSSEGDAFELTVSCQGG